MSDETMTLTDFLLARIAEDAGIAESVAPAPWRTVDTGDDVVVISQDFGEEVASTDSVNVEHIARHDPARVLAECEAKRQIVEALIDAEDAVATYNNDDPNNPPAYWQEWGNRHALRLAAELLALPYADHPDYREEWRP